MENNENFTDYSADMPEGQTLDEVCRLPDNHSGIKMRHMIRSTFFIGVLILLIGFAVVL